MSHTMHANLKEIMFNVLNIRGLFKKFPRFFNVEINEAPVLSHGEEVGETLILILDFFLPAKNSMHALTVSL